MAGAGALLDQHLDDDLTWDEVATAVTVGYLTGGVILTVALERRGRWQICRVLRCPAGFAAWVVFSLHLWCRPLDIVHHLARLIARRTP